MDALDKLRVLDVRGCGADGPTLGRVLASRAVAPAIVLPCWGAGADPVDDVMDTDEPTPRARPQLEVRCDVDDLTRRRLQARFRDGVKVVSALAEAERAKRAAQMRAPPPASRLSRSLAATATSMAIPGHMNPRRMAQPARAPADAPTEL